MVGRARAIAALDRRERASGDQPPPASAHGDGGILSELWQIERNWGFDVQAAKQTLLMKSHTSNIVALVGLRCALVCTGVRCLDLLELLLELEYSACPCIRKKRMKRMKRTRHLLRVQSDAKVEALFCFWIL